LSEHAIEIGCDAVLGSAPTRESNSPELLKGFRNWCERGDSNPPRFYPPDPKSLCETA